MSKGRKHEKLRQRRRQEHLARIAVREAEAANRREAGDSEPLGRTVLEMANMPPPPPRSEFRSALLRLKADFALGDIRSMIVLVRWDDGLTESYWSIEENGRQQILLGLKDAMTDICAGKLSGEPKGEPPESLPIIFSGDAAIRKNFLQPFNGCIQAFTDGRITSVVVASYWNDEAVETYWFVHPNERLDLRKRMEAFFETLQKKHPHLMAPNAFDPTDCLKSLRLHGGGPIDIDGLALFADGTQAPLANNGKYAADLLRVPVIYTFGNMLNSSHPDFLGLAALRQLATETAGARFDFPQEIILHLVFNGRAVLSHLRNGRETEEPLVVRYLREPHSKWHGSVARLEDLGSQGGFAFLNAPVEAICWHLLRRSAGYRYVNGDPLHREPSEALPAANRASVAKAAKAVRIVYVNKTEIIRPYSQAVSEPTGRTVVPHDRHYQKMTYDRAWFDKHTGELRHTTCHRRVMVAKVKGGAEAADTLPPMNVVRLANPILAK